MGISSSSWLERPCASAPKSKVESSNSKQCDGDGDGDCDETVLFGLVFSDMYDLPIAKSPSMVMHRT